MWKFLTCEGYLDAEDWYGTKMSFLLMGQGHHFKWQEGRKKYINPKYYFCHVLNKMVSKRKKEF